MMETVNVALKHVIKFQMLSELKYFGYIKLS